MGKGQTPVTEQKQGIELVDAAAHHEHVKQFVYTSADRGGAKSSSDPTNIPHFISKYHVEKHLIQKAHGSNMGYTIFRPVAFMDNMTNDFPGMICLVHVLLRCVCLIVDICSNSQTQILIIECTLLLYCVLPYLLQTCTSQRA